jgi:type I restriction enzyme M protein
MAYIDNKEKISDIENKAQMIWSIADKLTGAYKPHEYGLVILPFTVLRRLDCALEPTRDQVIAKYEEIKNYPEDIKETILRQVSGLDYYSTNKKGLRSVLNNPKDVGGSLRRFIGNFSKNVQEVLSEFNIYGQIERLENTSSGESGLLNIIVDEFTQEKNDLSPSKVSDIDMGYIFEHIIRKFSESYNEDAGQHYTPRDAIDLMVELLIRKEDRESKKEIARTIVDQACGTGGMLSEALEYTASINPKIHLQCYGQEYNPETYAICKANMLMKDPRSRNVSEIVKGDTLSNYQFKGKKFNYVIMNPPFGREWKVQEEKVRAEAADSNGRFSIGLPQVSDSQMLFLSSAISTLESPNEGNLTGGRITIVHSGSPLFSGDAGSGPSEIRRHILENDLLDAIIALPENIFYNTGIGTYIWVLDNNKENRRKGKVQFIDARNMYDPRRKNVGMKRFDINRAYIDTIVKAYREFTDSSYEANGKVCESKIIAACDFGYVKLGIIAPELDDDGNPKKNTKGKTIYDKSKNDYETVPLKNIVLSPGKDLLKDPNVRQLIDDHMRKEVLPYVKYAEIDHRKVSVGYEIPFTRYFYKYVPPRPSEDIMAEIQELNCKINDLMRQLTESLETGTER